MEGVKLLKVSVLSNQKKLERGGREGCTELILIFYVTVQELKFWRDMFCQTRERKALYCLERDLESLVLRRRQIIALEPITNTEKQVHWMA